MGRKNIAGKKIAYEHILSKNLKMSYFLQILVWNCFEQLFKKISYLNQFTFAKRSIKCFAKSTIYHRNELLKHPVNAVSKISGFVSTGLFMIVRTLRSNDATATRTSLKNWICVLSVFIAVIPTHLLCRM